MVGFLFKNTELFFFFFFWNVFVFELKCSWHGELHTIPALMSDNYICLNLDLSVSFNQVPLLQSQHVGQRAVYLPIASFQKCKVDLPLFQRSCRGLCHIWSNPALPCSLFSDVARCLAKSFSVCMLWVNELFNTLVPFKWFEYSDILCYQSMCSNIPCAPSRYVVTPL